MSVGYLKDGFFLAVLKRSEGDSFGYSKEIKIRFVLDSRIDPYFLTFLNGGLWGIISLCIF